VTSEAGIELTSLDARRVAPAAVDRWMRWRAAAVCTGLGALLIVTAGQVASIQILRHDQYERLAVRQQTREQVVPAPAGRILDRQFRILATSTTAPSICADPAAIVDKPAAAAALAEATGLDPEVLRRQLIDRGTRRFMWVARKVDQDVAANVAALRLDGVWVAQEPKRLYPAGRLASHVIGFRGLDDKGLEGLERQYDTALSGTPGEETCRVDAHGRRIAGPDSVYRPPVPGASLVTTLDGVVQLILEAELDALVERWDPIGVAGIVMAPSTGEVLAMSSRPTYDLSNLANASAEGRRNRCITGPVEPGSTFKPFIASGVLSRNLAGLDDQFFCHNGLYLTHGRRLRDHDPYGWLTFVQIVSKSSNVGMARLGELMGARALQETIRAFGFGRATGIDLAGEDQGQVTSPQRWSSYTTTSVPMGQEISVTPLQLATAFCAIANGGYLVRPHLIRYLLDAEGRMVEDHREPKRVRRVLSQEVARTMIDPVLIEVVETGTGKQARLSRWPRQVFGKTGTAQKALRGGGGFSHSAFVSSFIGSAPADDPQVVVLIMVDEPRKPGSRYGGTVAAPSVGRVIERTLDYLQATAATEPRWARLAAATPLARNAPTLARATGRDDTGSGW
jgi:cell division protein FtsI (penicillin-binding protein 3)